VALIEAGADFGMRLGGETAYSSVTVESGWIPLPVPSQGQQGWVGVGGRVCRAAWGADRVWAGQADAAGVW
jgi:hypothetical protein